MKRRKMYPIARLSCPHCGKTIVLKRTYGVYMTPEDKAEKRKNKGGKGGSK